MNFLNPDGHGLSSLWSSKKEYNALNINFSNILSQISKRVTGRKFLALVYHFFMNCNYIHLLSNIQESIGAGTVLKYQIKRFADD